MSLGGKGIIERQHPEMELEGVNEPVLLKSLLLAGRSVDGQRKSELLVRRQTTSRGTEEGEEPTQEADVLREEGEVRRRTAAAAEEGALRRKSAAAGAAEAAEVVLLPLQLGRLGPQPSLMRVLKEGRREGGDGQLARSRYASFSSAREC